MTNRNSFERKLEKAISKPFTSSKKTEEILSAICSSKNHALFFDKIRESNIHKKLFFLHRFDLLGVENTIPLPCLYLTNVPRQSQGDVQESRVLKHVISEKSNIIHDSKDFLLSLLNIPEDIAFEIEENFKDVFAYYILLFIRSNKNLMKLVTGKEFSFKIMKSILSDYKNTIDFESIQKDITAIFEGNDKNTDADIRIKFEKIIQRIINLITKDSMASLEMPQKAMPNLMLALHLPCKMWLIRILNRTGMALKNYVDILDDLYINRLISNKSTVFWCETCGLEKPFYSSYYGDIAPSKIRNCKCLNCGKNQSYSCFFALDELLKDSIFIKDGFLSVYLSWLLHKAQIPFKVNVCSTETENDFIVNDKILIECKMFKKNKDDMAIKSELESSLVQIRQHINSLAKDKLNIKHAYFIWNRYYYPKNLILGLSTRFRDLLTKYDLQVFNPEKFEDLVTKLKK